MTLKSRIFSSISVVALIAFVALIFTAEIAFSMHFGEPAYFHAARVICGVAAVICALVSFISSLVAAHF